MSQRYEQRQEEHDQEGSVASELHWPGKRTAVDAAMKGAPEGAAANESDPRRPDISRIRAAIGGLTSGGEKLDAGTAGKFGGQLGVDLSSVTLHKDNTAAAELGASAFTHGDHVAIAPGVDLASGGGQHVLAHELVHVAQNMAAGGSSMELAARMDVGPSNSPAEAQAEAGASALVAGQGFSAGGIGALPGISMFEGPPPPEPAPAPTGTPTNTDEIPATDPRSPDYDPSKDPAVLAQLAQVPTVNTQQQATPPPVPAPKPEPAPPPTPGPAKPPTTPTAAPASPQRPTLGPAPAPKAPKTSPTVNLDELVKQTLEQRADPQAKQSYSNATNQIDILRIQAVQYAFQPTGLGSNILAGLWPWEAWKQHGREISLTNPYDTGSLQAWIEGARATIRILGDVAAWVATIADIVAAVSGLLAIISSWTGAGLVIFGAIAAIAAEVGTIAGLIKIILDIIDVVIGVVQMILTIKKIKASKDPAERAKLGALLGREVKEVSGAVVGIGVQVVTIVATAGLAAGVTGMLQKTTKGFWKNFGSELFKEFRPILAPKQSIAAIRDAAKLGVRAPKQALRENVDPKSITKKEIADGAVTVERIETRRELVKSRLSRAQRKKRGRLREFRDVVTKSQKPVLGPNDLKVPKSGPGKNDIKRQVRFIVDPNKLKTGIPKAEIEGFSVDASAIIPGQAAGQVQARAKKTGDASAPPERTGQLPGTQGDAGTSPLTQVAMWPSQLETLKATKAALPAANDRLGTMYNLAKGQAGAYQSGQFEKVFAGVKNAAGQMRLGALQQQQDATEGATQSEKGATTAAQGKQQKGTLDGKTSAMDASTQKMGAQKVEKPPPKEGGSWWDKAKNWLYNQTIGRIGDAIGGLQSWLTKSIGGWVMAQSGLTKEELDMAGIENSMRADHQKDKQTEAEMKAAQEEANKVDPKLAEIMKGANADEQAALQAMMESQEFITAIDEAQKALDEAIAAGSTYITEVSPIIRHEMETQTGGKAIDEAYVAPVIGGANALKGAVGGGEEMGAAAAADVIAELTEAQTWWPELNLGPSTAGVNEAKQAFVGSHNQLANTAKAAADGVITKVQGLVGSQDYAGVHDAAKSLDGVMDKYSADEDALVDVYLRNLERVLDATADLIQSAVTQQEVDVPADETPVDAPVQRKADGGAVNDNADPGAVAAAGTKGPGGQLPHFDRIQQSFGRHDVSGVQAHVGGDAAAAAGNLGAKAFATGNKVAFAGDPDLHTAAHEAAHVVQQRQGVSLKALDGGSSDSHEQHADKVADAVVAGQSAEALLDKPGATPAAHEASHATQQPKADAPVGKAVQRKQADAPQPRGAEDKEDKENKDKADPSAAAPKAPSGTSDISDEVKADKPKGKDEKAAVDKVGGKPKAADGAKGKADGKDKAAVPPVAKDAKADAADAPAPATPKPAAAPKPVLPADLVQPVAVAPVTALSLAVPASDKKTDDKWLKDTGRTPAAHQAQIQSELDALTAEIQTKQTELMTLADTEATRIGNDMAAKVAGFTSTVVAPGRARIEAAYGGMTKSIDAAETQAKAQIAATKTQGTSQIAATKAAKGQELTTKFTGAKAGNQAVVKKTAPLAVAAIQKFSQSLQPFIAKAKQDATAVTTAMTADAQFDPAQHSAASGLGGGTASLRADIGKNVIVAHGKAVGANYEKKLGSFGQDIEAKAQTIVEEALKPAKDELDIAVDTVSGQTKKSLDAAEVTAKSQLDTTEQAASKAVADAKVGATQKWATEKASSIAAADQAGKALADNTTAAGTELTSRIKKKASEDAQSYGKLAAGVQASLKSGKARKYEDVAPQIAEAKQRLAAGHQENLQSLRQLVTTGGTELGATLTKQQDLYSQAIKTQEEQAKGVEATLTKDITKSATDMQGSLGGLSKGFDDAATKQNAALDNAVNEFNANAQGALADFDKKVTEKLTAVKTQLDQELATDLSKDKITGLANTEIQKQLKAKQKSAITDSGALRTAMDGYGTDENAIYGILRKCSWGEIEYLEATYDNHYDNRGKDGMRPLRYDLWDEMSKGELAIAMAYLNHDRKTALKLELDDSKGWLWNDNKRIESVLRSASEEEITHLNTDPGAVATLASIKNSFWTSDKDVFNTLLDQSMSREDRATKANAIRLFGAMDGWGTDEAEVKRLLQEAATPEERARLRAQFNAYAAARNSSWATDTKDRRDEDDREDGKGDVDALDRALTDDFGSGEVHYVRELAKEQRDETAVNMGKIVEAADGMGTDEDAVFDALEDPEYAKLWAAAKAKGDTAEMARLETERKEKLDKLLARMGHKKGIANLINEEMDAASLVTEYDSEGMPVTRVAISYEELLAGKRKDGTAITASDRAQLRGGFGLEGMVAQRKLQTGQAEPELQLAYACWGVTGTHEEMINKAISDGGEPKSLGDLKAIAAKFQEVWGVALVARWEIENPQGNVPDKDMQFPDPGGLLSAELGGKDWLKTRVLLCGKPETAPQLRYVQKLQVNYAKSGILSAPLMWAAEKTGYSDAAADQRNSEKKFDAKYAQIAAQLGGNLDVTALANIGKDAKGNVQKGEDGQDVATGDDLQLLSEYLQQDTEAYAKALASVVDAIVTVLEIVGGIIVTVVTAGTAAPVLAAIIGNLIVSAGTIAFKYAALGDQYGAGDLAKDVVQAAVTAGFAGLGEVKALKTLTENAGKATTGALFRTVNEGVNAGGGRLIGTTIELGPKGISTVQGIVREGTKNVIISSGQEVANFLTDEKTYEMKLGEALWGENSLGARLAKGLPKAFVEGGVKQFIDDVAHVSNMDNRGGHKTPFGNMLANAMSDAGANVAGFFVYVDNYNDASHFWEELLKSTGKKAASGFFQGYGMHKMRAKKTGRDFINGEIDAAGLIEMLSYLDPKEVRELAQFVKKYGGDKVDGLPEQFKKELGAPAAKPANVPATTPTPVAKPTVDAADSPGVTTEPATPKKADDAPAADSDPAAKAKADHDAATAAKAKADADAAALKAQQDAEAAKAQQKPKPEDKPADQPAAHPDDKAAKPAEPTADDKAKPAAATDKDKPVAADKDKPVAADKGDTTTTAPVGAHRGKDVFGSHEADGKIVKTTAKDLSTAIDGLGGRKVTVGAVHDSGATMEVHVDGPDGKPIKVPVKVVVSDALPPSPHGEDGGAARFTLAHENGQWTATVHVQQGLHPNDIRFVLGHEVDEISTLVGAHPNGHPAGGLGTQMKAGVLGGGADTATAHDKAGAKEIVDLYNDWKRLDAEGSPEAARRKAVLQRALEAQGLTDSAHAEAKRKLLADAGATEDLLDHVVKGATAKKPIAPDVDNVDGVAKPKTAPKDEPPSKELVDLATQAYQRYSAEIGNAVQTLKEIAGELGEVGGRAKEPESAANRLQRALKNGWVKEISTVDQAVDNTWDALGTRLVVHDGKDMGAVVQALSEAIKSGKLKITEVNNLEAKTDGLPYMTPDQIHALAKTQMDANTEAGSKDQVKANSSKPMDGGFTGVMIYVQYPSGVRGEIQIIGKKALAVADIEHIPYDIGLGKPIVRNIDPRVEPEMRAALAPVEEAMKKVNANPATKAAYEKYLAELYKHARELELGGNPPPPPLPDGIDKSLSMDGLQRLKENLDALKAKSKALKIEDEKNAIGSAKGKGVYDMAGGDAAPVATSKIDAEGAKKLVELHEEIKRLEAAKSPEAEAKKQELAQRLAGLHDENLDQHRKLLADAGAPADLLEHLKPGAKPKPGEEIKPVKPATTNEAEVTTGDATAPKPSAIKPAVTDADKKSAADLADSVEGLRQTFGDQIAAKNTKLVGPPADRPVLKQGAGDALIGLPLDVISPTADAATAIAKLKQEGIPRWGALTENERKHETAFSSVLEQNLETMVGEFYQRSRDDKMNAHVFEVDGAKKLYVAYGGGKAPASPDETQVRATANHALHPAAVAIARLAFLQHLDHLKSLDPNDPQRSVLVTNGGCASGKGSLTGMVQDMAGGKFKYGAVWDAAGEGDASENGWIMQAAQARGLKVTYGFVESDPNVTYGGVLDRAESTGRIVDPVTFTRSYVKGQENMRAFLESPEYQAALARGEVETVGVYTGKFDMATKTFPNKRVLGDNGKIGADDLAKPPSETEISANAAKIFEAWLKKQQADGKPTDHWVEGGIVNPLKFDPNAGGASDGKAAKPTPVDAASPADPKAVKPGDDTKIKADDPVLKPKTEDPATPVDTSKPSTKGTTDDKTDDAAATGSHKGKDVFPVRREGDQPVKYNPAELTSGLEPLATRKGAKVEIGEVTEAGATMKITVTPAGGGEPVVINVKLKLSTELTPVDTHNGDGGAARFKLDAEDGQWKATITLAQGLDPKDIRFVVGHEIDEIADIAGKHPTGNAKKAMADETTAGVTRDNDRGTKIKSHDIAAAKEIIELFNDWQRLLADGNDAEAARRKETLDRALKANNLHELNEAKVALLTEVEAPAALLNHLREPAEPSTPKAKPPLKVEPGTIPPDLSPAKKAIFEEAAAHHLRLKNSAYHGPDFADLAWQQFLKERGIHVEIRSSQAKSLGYKDQAVTASEDLLQREKRAPMYEAEVSVPMDAAVGARSPTLHLLDHGVPLAAFKQMATQAAGYKVIGHVDGQLMEIEVTGADGQPKRVFVKLMQPTVIADGGMAGMRHDPKTKTEIHIWLSDTLPDDQVHRALGAIMGKVVAAAKRSGTDGPMNPAESAQAAAVGQVDALLGHLEVTRAKNTQPEEALPTALPPDAAPEAKLVNERAKAASRNAKRENEDRIAAELDLLLEQHPELVKAMPPDLAAKVEKFRKGRQQLGFEPGKVIDSSQLPKKPVAEETNRPSLVLPGAPTELRPYSEADKAKILELKVVFETIKEIDARLAQRDQANTSTRDVTIAAGETMRRKEMVAKAQALMELLQLGGSDPAYYQARLKELDEVFPGAHSAIGDGVMTRVTKRVESDKAHAEAEQYKARARAKSEALEQMLESTAKTPDQPFKCDRIVVGDGPTGLANIAGLAEQGIKPDKDGFIDPKKMLVVGGADLIARMAEADPNMKWGQRPEVFDGEQKHPIFRGGQDELHRTSEDTGDFSSVGQVSDAMDLARSRIGVARAQATVLRVELQDQPGATGWAESDYPVRVVMLVNGKEVVVYTKATDITTGIGQARLPDEAILAVKDRKRLLEGPDKVMISGEQAMMDADLAGDKVLVFGYGPTGAWAAIEATRRGATSVDWGGSSAQLPKDPKKKYAGDDSQKRAGANEGGFADLRKVDRVQEALDPETKINITTDRIAKIEPQGSGAVVTYARGEPPAVETYQVHYTKIVNASAPSTDKKVATVTADQPKAGNIVEGIPLAPQQGTQAPVYTSKNDLVRVMGPAADGISGDNIGENKSMDKTMTDRRDAIPRVADSPDHRVMEATGTAVDLANGIDPKAPAKTN